MSTMSQNYIEGPELDDLKKGKETSRLPKTSSSGEMGGSSACATLKSEVKKNLNIPNVLKFLVLGAAIILFAVSQRALDTSRSEIEATNNILRTFIEEYQTRVEMLNADISDIESRIKDVQSSTTAIEIAVNDIAPKIPDIVRVTNEFSQSESGVRSNIQDIESNIAGISQIVESNGNQILRAGNLGASLSNLQNSLSHIQGILDRSSNVILKDGDLATEINGLGSRLSNNQEIINMASNSYSRDGTMKSRIDQNTNAVNVIQSALADVTGSYGILLGQSVSGSCTSMSYKVGGKMLNGAHEIFVNFECSGLSMHHTGTNNVFERQFQITYKGSVLAPNTVLSTTGHFAEGVTFVNEVEVVQQSGSIFRMKAYRESVVAIADHKFHISAVIYLF